MGRNHSILKNPCSRALVVLTRPFAYGGGEAWRGTGALGGWGRGGAGSCLRRAGRAARDGSRGSGRAQVGVGARPGLCRARRASCSLPPRQPAATHRAPRPARAGTHANKDASIYSPLPVDF